MFNESVVRYNLITLQNKGAVKGRSGVIKDTMSSANKFHLRHLLITEQIISRYECLMALPGPADFPHTRSNSVALYANSIAQFPDALG